MYHPNWGNSIASYFELRQTGDYDDWKVITENDIKPLIPLSESFLDTLESIIRQDSYID